LARHAGTAAVAGFFAATERVQGVLAALGEDTDVAGVIHGDLRLRRVRFHGDRIGAVGFDRCRWGYFATDIEGLLADLRGRGEADALRGALLDGYRSVRPITEETIAQLPAFEALRAIDQVVRILARGHDPAGADPTDALEHPLAQLAVFADA
jgi:Ser/Thr protein kinase RdoA (MazF antagonist)